MVDNRYGLFTLFAPDSTFVKDFLSWCEKHYPALTIFIIILVTAVIGTVWVYKVYLRFKKTEIACEVIPGIDNKIKENVSLAQNIEKKIDNELLDLMKVQVSNSTKLEKNLTLLEKNVHSLVSFLSAKHKDLNSDLYISKSPIQLTPFGHEVLEKTGGKKCIDDNINSFLDEMEKQVFKSALDVQEFAFTAIMNETSSDKFTPVKNYIYQNPIYPTKSGKGLELVLHTVCNIMSIYLRDKYFEKHPELRDVE